MISRIQVDRVTRLFGATAALRGVTCQFEAGTATFVEGPNGAGKSTLLAIVGTVLRPSSGTVTYGSGLSREDARRHIGWVGHESHCYRELTGRENVALAAGILGLDTASVAVACGRVRAERFFDQPVGSLSRGQKQRVALARALVGSPSVLLLDEPLTGLDPETVSHFDNVLTEEQDRGAIVVVVSHTPGWAERLNARRMRIERGRVAESARE